MSLSLVSRMKVPRGGGGEGVSFLASKYTVETSSVNVVNRQETTCLFPHRMYCTCRSM
jgi:hypothetical protein